MIRLIKKRWKYLAIILLLGGLYFLTRLTNLTKLPIFTDEAIYIRWAQIGLYDASWRFISLTDGKQPLFPWLMMMTLRLIKDPLLGGRLASVLSGMVGVTGIGVLAFELFGSLPIAFVASFFYILSPFTTWYDRMALYDSLVAGLSIWNLYLGILLVKKKRLDIALIFGMILGLGMLNKTSGFLSLYMAPATLLLFQWKQKRFKFELFRWAALLLVSLGISQVMYGVLRLSPYFHMIAQKDTVFLHSYREFPTLWKYFIGNISGLSDWLIHYLTWPILVLGLGSILFPKFRKEKLLLLIWWIAPFVALGYFGKVLYPRFILFMTMPLLLLAAMALFQSVQYLGKRVYTIAFVFFVLFLSVRCTYYVVTDPMHAPIPFADRGQMIDDWPSGYGFPEVHAYFDNELKKGKKIAVITEGTFGLFPYAFEMYYWNNPNIIVKGLWPVLPDMPIDISELSLERDTYLVMNQSQFPPTNWPLVLIAEYNKGTNPDVKMRLYKIYSRPFAFRP